MRYDFSNSNIANYRKSLEDSLKSGKMAELLSDIYSKEADINNIISKCQTLLIDNSENCRKQYRKCELKHEPWFNSECKTLKQGKTKSLREYRKAKTVNNLDKYKQARNNFKQKCKTEKENYYSHKLESLIESSENPKSFWRKLKILSNKKATVKNNITLEQWREYFEKLFECDADPDEQNINNMFEEEPVEDDIEDFIFNSDITEEEI